HGAPPDEAAGKPTAEPVTEPVAEAGVYEDEHIRFEYPAEWSTLEMGEYQYIYPSLDTPTTLLYVYAVENAMSFELMEMAFSAMSEEDLAAMIAAMAGDDMTVNSIAVETVELAGVSALLVTADVETMGLKFDMDIYVFLTGTHQVMLYWSGEAGQYEAEVQAILSSIELK
ncbi:MAG: hypothetical protein Q4C01_05365, partial [Clostridia bacterium]|nr:hypothetical protein [Clostridia bacterium]